MPSQMPTWRNQGWLQEPLQNWRVKQGSPQRDFRRNCIVWSREEMERHHVEFERLRAEHRLPLPARPSPTPRHRRMAAHVDDGWARARSVKVEVPARSIATTASWQVVAPPKASVPVAHPRAAAPSHTLLDDLGLGTISSRELSVGILLVALPPLGVMLLWSGNRDRDTKVVTTVVAMMWMLAVTLVLLTGILTLA